MQWREAVGVPVEHIELVCHFVDDHVVPGFLSAIQHIRPRQDHRPAPPCLTGQYGVGLVNHPRGVDFGTTWNECVLVHDDAVPAVVPIETQFQDGYASMGREQNTIGV